MSASGDPRPDRDRRLEGWGGKDDAPELSPEQVARLQERDEPVADANFGAALRGDLGNAEVADESVDAPETVVPDTSLGHEGGRRYREPGTADAATETTPPTEGEGHGRTEPGRGPTAAGGPA